MHVILVSVAGFYLGFLVGYLCKAWLTNRFKDYSGTIYVSHDDLSEKVVYSLVLEDYPEKLEFKKVVVFKVDTSEEDHDRK